MDQPKIPHAAFTLKEIIALGEYDPEVLSKHPEWQELSNNARFQLIIQGLENRRSQLFKKWGEVINFMNESDNPNLQEDTKKNLEEQFKQLRIDKEELYLEYSKLS